MHIIELYTLFIINSAEYPLTINEIIIKIKKNLQPNNGLIPSEYFKKRIANLAGINYSKAKNQYSALPLLSREDRSRLPILHEYSLTEAGVNLLQGNISCLRPFIQPEPSASFNSPENNLLPPQSKSVGVFEYNAEERNDLEEQIQQILVDSYCDDESTQADKDRVIQTTSRIVTAAAKFFGIFFDLDINEKEFVYSST